MAREEFSTNRFRSNRFNDMCSLFENIPWDRLSTRKNRWWNRFEGGKRDQVYFHFGRVQTWSHLILILYLGRGWRASCIVQICTETIYVMSVWNRFHSFRLLLLVLIYFWCDYYYFIVEFFSVVVLFFLLLCPSVSLCLVSIPITNGSFTIAWQMRYWQFDDCSFMSRSMWYVTKRSYLTFYSNEMKIGFSLIFTCCVQSHVKYHWLQLFRHQIKLPIITDAEAFQSDFQFIRW